MFSKNIIVNKIIDSNFVECRKILVFLSFQSSRLDYCAGVFINSVLETCLIKYRYSTNCLLPILESYRYVQEFLKKSTPPYHLQSGYCLKCNSPSRSDCIFIPIK